MSTTWSTAIPTARCLQSVLGVPIATQSMGGNARKMISAGTMDVLVDVLRMCGRVGRRNAYFMMDVLCGLSRKPQGPTWYGVTRRNVDQLTGKTLSNGEALWFDAIDDGLHTGKEVLRRARGQWIGSDEVVWLAKSLAIRRRKEFMYVPDVETRECLKEVAGETVRDEISERIPRELQDLVTSPRHVNVGLVREDDEIVTMKMPRDVDYLSALIVNTSIYHIAMHSCGVSEEMLLEGLGCLYNSQITSLEDDPTGAMERGLVTWLGEGGGGGGGGGGGESTTAIDRLYNVYARYIRRGVGHLFPEVMCGIAMEFYGDPVYKAAKKTLGCDGGCCMTLEMVDEKIAKVRRGQLQGDLVRLTKYLRPLVAASMYKAPSPSVHSF